MKARAALWPVAFAVVLGVTAFVMRARDPARSQEHNPPPVVTPVQEIPKPEVTPSSDPPASVPNSLTLTGTITSAAQATLSTRMPTRIVAVNVQQGDTVRHGQALVLLDPAEARTQSETAQAGVTAAEAQVRKARVGRSAQTVKADSDIATAQSGLRQALVKWQQAQLARDAARDDARADARTAQEGVRKAEAAFKRAQDTLHELEELAKVGGVSRSDLEGARTQVSVAQSDLETARAQAQRAESGPGDKGMLPYRVALAQKDVYAAVAGVRQAREGVRAAEEARRQTLALADQDIFAAEAALAQAKAGLSGAAAAQRATQLVSPLDGIATSVGARAGETAQPGAPLVTVVSLFGLRVEALAVARQLPLLHVGQSASVSVDTQPDRTLPAVVQEVARVAEPDGRSFRVVFHFRETVSVRPGQIAHITILPNKGS